MNPRHKLKGQGALVTGVSACCVSDRMLPRRSLVAATFGFCVAASSALRAQQATLPALRYNALTSGPAPVPPSEQGLQTIVAEPWFKVSDEGIVLEGPAFDRVGNLFLCDVSGGRVLRVAPDRRLSTVLHMDLKPGGIAIARDGRLFVAALDIPKGLGTVVAMQSDGSGLQTVVPPSAGFMPNDLVFDRMGGLYFTDFRGSSTDPQGGVYYVPSGSEKAVQVIGHVAKANGIALSPDGTFLWFTEFGRNQLYRAELADTMTAVPLGTAIPYRFIGPAPDSMRTDTDGNVYVALYGQGRVLAFNGIGLPIGQVLLPDREQGHNLQCTNMALKPGTRELLIVASDGAKGRGATIFRAEAFADALPLYSHQ